MPSQTTIFIATELLEISRWRWDCIEISHIKEISHIITNVLSKLINNLATLFEFVVGNWCEL